MKIHKRFKNGNVISRGRCFNLVQFGSYDFISRMRCFDLYFDPSQVEGWGLPQGEALNLEVPLLMPDDQHVRTEVYGHAAIHLKTLDPGVWDWWDNGSKLVNFDPLTAARQIARLRSSNGVLAATRSELPEKVAHLKWKTCTDKVLEKVIDLIGGPAT